MGVLWLSVACSESPRKPEVGPDAGPDAGSDAGSDASVDGNTPHASCDEYAQTVRDFVEAYSVCATNSDCVTLGNCSNAEFFAVAADAAQEGKALIDGRPASCRAQDGPAYGPVCFENVCQKLGSVAACGGAIAEVCPSGQSFHRDGCSAQTPFVDGCYATCDDEHPCSSGSRCQVVESNTCHAGPGDDDDCVTCETMTLCLPEPDCEFLVSVEFQRGARVVALHAEVAEINLVVENLGNDTRSIEYVEPCHGPFVQGLDGYDLWDSCVKGACTGVETKITLTLGPRERRVLYTGYASPLPSTCNKAGLSRGIHALSWNLAGASGAKVCVLPASELRSGESAAP